jgi:hypothetical protein
MAGNRKNHRGQPTRRNSTSGSPLTNDEGIDPNGKKSSNGEDPDATSDFNKVLQEGEGSFQVTWKEILVALVGVFLLALFSICVGIVAGMTISIHYYENQSPMVRTGRLDAVSRSGTNNHHTSHYEPAAITAATGLYGGNAAYQRVTILDPMIVSSNVMKNKDSENGGSLDLGKVIMTTASGQLNVLMVVEETPPLIDAASVKEGDEADYYGSSTTNGSSAPHGDDSSSSASDETTDSQPGRTSEQNQKHSDYNIHHNSNPRRNLQHQSKNNVHSNNHAREYDYRSSNSHYRQIAAQPRALVDVRDSKIRPTLCSDGITYGYDTWHTFKGAVQEANAISAERFMRWNEFFAAQSGVGSMTGPYTFTSFLDDSLYYEEDVVFTICPGAVLKARRGPIFLNAENVLIECDGGCTIDVGGTHLAFGPHARNVLVRGITFTSARTSSLTFFHDGAEASFEECFWIGNAGINGKYGAVADVNSTSTVNFYRCEISQGKKGYGSMPPGFASSLSIRA